MTYSISIEQISNGFVVTTSSYDDKAAEYSEYDAYPMNGYKSTRTFCHTAADVAVTVANSLTI